MSDQAEQGAKPELKPCPFCGSDNTEDIRFMQVAATNRRYRRCGYCEAHGPVGIGKEADRMWNQRPAEDAAAKLFEASQAILARLDYLRGLWGDEGVMRRMADQIREAISKVREAGIGGE